MKSHFYYLGILVSTLCRCCGYGLETNEWGPVSDNVRMMISLKPGEERVFGVQNIKDLPQLVRRLTQRADPISDFLWQKISHQDQLLLHNFRPSASENLEVEQIVVNALNSGMIGPCIYEGNRFKGISLRPQTIALLNLQQGTIEIGAPNLARLNLMLLEDAFSAELSAGSMALSGAIKIGQPVTLLIAVTNMSDDTAISLYFSRGTVLNVDDSFVVTTPSGKRQASDWHDLFAGSGSVHGLGTHQMIAYDLHLSQLCRFDETGKYTATITRYVRRDIKGANKIEVTSNPLTIEVFPDK